MTVARTITCNVHLTAEDIGGITKVNSEAGPVTVSFGIGAGECRLVLPQSAKPVGIEYDGRRLYLWRRGDDWIGEVR